MKEKVLIGLVAGLGGAAPNLLQLAIMLTKGDTKLPDISYLAGILIFAMLGGAVGLIWGEKDLKKAFYLGVGLPSLIQVSVNNATTDQAVAFLGTEQSSFSLVPVALAYSQPASSSAMDVSFQGGRNLKLAIQKEAPAFMVLFRSGDGTKEERVAAEGGAREYAFPVPEFAATFEVRLGNDVSAPVRLSADTGGVTQVTVQFEGVFGSGFLKAFGVRNATQYKIMIQKR